MCSGSKRILTVGILLSFLFCSVAFIPSTGYSQQTEQRAGSPDVTIDLVQDSLTAEVGPGDDGMVEFDGVVNVTKPPGMRVVVSLTAEDTWGTAVASPSSLLFDQNGVKEFVVTVRARSRESCEEVGFVKVFGRWSLYPGSLSGSAEPQEGAQSVIYIAQFYKFTLGSTKNRFIEVKPGSEVVFDLSISNKGNGQDFFSIKIQNIDELSDKDIQVKLSESEVVINEKQNRFFEIHVELPSDTDIIGFHNIKIEVESDNGIHEGIPSQGLTYTVKIPEEDIFATTEFSMFLNIFVIILIVVFIVLFWRWHKKRGV